jgi:hypothetical protein
MATKKSSDSADAVDLDNDAYVGTDPIYKNHAYDEQKPLKGEELDIEKVVRENEAERAKGVPVQGFTALSQDGSVEGDDTDDADVDGADNSASGDQGDGGDVPV